MPKPSEESLIWRKLAQSHIVFDNQEGAYKVLLTASEVCSRVWEIWRDLLVISCSCKHYDTAVRSYDRILNLKRDYKSEEYLRALSEGVWEGMGSQGNSQLREGALRVFSRVLQDDDSDPMVWVLYGKTTAYTRDVTQAVRSNTASRLYRALEVARKSKRWIQNKDAVIYVLRSELGTKYF
jgi:hypothetical protein